MSEKTKRDFLSEEDKVGRGDMELKNDEIAREERYGNPKDQIRVICGQIDRYLKKEEPHRKSEEKKI